jgi:uncharacterized protein (TIGR02284 family)
MDQSVLKKLNSLIQLDIDAIYCYNEALKHIDDRDVASTLEGYRDDHQQHVDDLSAITSGNGGEPPKQNPDMQGILLKGITALRSVTGTEGALKAMESNEKKTNDEYGKAQAWDVSPDVQRVLRKNYDDEKRHLAYVQSQLHVTA